jgi:hypothetical protein
MFEGIHTFFLAGALAFINIPAYKFAATLIFDGSDDFKECLSFDRPDFVSLYIGKISLKNHLWQSLKTAVWIMLCFAWVYEQYKLLLHLLH